MPSLNNRPDDLLDIWSRGYYSDGIDRVYGDLALVAARLYGDTAEYFSNQSLIIQNNDERRSINTKLSNMHCSKTFVCEAWLVDEIEGVPIMSTIPKSLLLDKVRPDITIELKVGMPIILTKDCTHIRPGEEMVYMKKGSRLVVVDVDEWVVIARGISPGKIGRTFNIGRTMLHCDNISDKDNAYLRHQFPVVIGYANAEGCWDKVAEFRGGSRICPA
ncbi:hypothetical protein PTTG_28436 [Puccinia triticina 1-1 BBBD Race 1]|uniref:Uncharacterized protein n=1 Tax=Puccinia triticina (isolate 1-1 / race 1 (BBBD)) TaxID=630390 RepID=A0A180GBU1_PUCT1|nr:hypothetical protein PTTG_28436 [Puccinia triticina 1-1 BBBD Race 1]